MTPLSPASMSTRFQPTGSRTTPASRTHPVEPRAVGGDQPILQPGFADADIPRQAPHRQATLGQREAPTRRQPAGQCCHRLALVGQVVSHIGRPHQVGQGQSPAAGGRTRGGQVGPHGAHVHHAGHPRRPSDSAAAANSSGTASTSTNAPPANSAPPDPFEPPASASPPTRDPTGPADQPEDAVPPSPHHRPRPPANRRLIRPADEPAPPATRRPAGPSTWPTRVGRRRTQLVHRPPSDGTN